MPFHRKKKSTEESAESSRPADSNAKDSDAPHSRLSTILSIGKEVKRAISPFSHKEPEIIEGGTYEANHDAFQAEMTKSEAQKSSKTGTDSSQRQTEWTQEEMQAAFRKNRGSSRGEKTTESEEP